jgi:hypothetical protein
MVWREWLLVLFLLHIVLTHKAHEGLAQSVFLFFWAALEVKKEIAFALVAEHLTPMCLSSSQFFETVYQDGEPVASGKRAYMAMGRKTCPWTRLIPVPQRQGRPEFSRSIPRAF